ncbi:MAG: 5-oxoprolinase [bacterium]|nr:MAG: 5-oxoprolinase [bacterium]
MKKEPNPYRFFVDTGGTFTDLIGIDPDGRVHRRKILSNGTLRGTVTEWVSSRTLKIDQKWKLKKNILNGFRFRIKGENARFESKVKSFHPTTNILELVSDVEEPFRREGISFELSSGDEAPVLAVRMVTGTGLTGLFPPMQMRLGTTKGTNALLEHKGARSVLFITKGFRDLLEIGAQQRPDIFCLDIKKRKPLPTFIIEVEERIDATGKILNPLIPDEYKGLIAEIKQTGIESAAVVFMNAYRNPLHENQFKNLLEESGMKFISVSTGLSPLIKILERAETTTVNACLSPVIHNYLNKITSVTGAGLLVMNSAGGLMKAGTFHPKDSLLSGPAGGVVGAAAKGIAAGYDQLITFDMGGTSTDVSRYDKGFDYRYELEVGDAHIFSPAVAIETVAAGGGSVCGFDGFKLTVGPQSAGADPGPACYGMGGPLTLTDVNLLLGRMDTQYFGIPVDTKAAEKRLYQLIAKIEKAKRGKPDPKTVLSGFTAIANEIMAGAIKKISTAKGFDPAGYVLIAFGGAGGMHATGIARLLNMKRVIVPADAGLLSAYGIGRATIEHFAEMQVLKRLSETTVDLDRLFTELEQRAISELTGRFEEGETIETRMKTVFLRFEGQDSTLAVEWRGKTEKLVAGFRKVYTGLFGHWAENREIEIESLRVKVALNDRQNREQAGKPVFKKAKAVPSHYIRSWNGKIRVETPVFPRSDLHSGQTVDGPAIVADDKSTTFVDKGWKMEIDAYDNLILSNRKLSANHKMENQKSHETRLELFSGRFMSVAANMGAVLQRTALSVNIKERLDFSCALLDREGFLVANAPHIPVHLGGLGMCVRNVLRHFEMNEGDTIVTNHPLYGGSHLPDVTLITPVFSVKAERLGFVVNRAHHAEIGGMSPGSMPPAATRLSEEGVVISPFYLVRNGKVDWSGMRRILEDAPYPSRLVEENLADLNAALAANLEGKRALLQLIKSYGKEEVQQYMKHLGDYATRKMEAVLAGFKDGIYEAEEFLDDDTPVRVKITIKGSRATFDFTGSGPVHPKNMNATPAIVNSVVIYVMRLLLKENIPLNDGLMVPVRIILPRGFLNPPFDRSPENCPAVVGGNVEVSQRLTDTLLKAFGVAACSQGTMNNVLFGNEKFGYYETICGGTGATEKSNGASAVHQHMTNTRITDPEVLEHRFPVRLNRFEVRNDSGGHGKLNGGEGVVREYTFLEDMELSLLSQHRKYQPYGMNGGNPGKTGEQFIIKTDKSVLEFQGVDHRLIKKGDTFVLKTPGGGGWGEK